MFNQAVGDKEALKWYRQAAEGGDNYAQRRLGCTYEEDEEGALDLKTDFDMALMWFKKAADGGDNYAQ